MASIEEQLLEVRRTLEADGYELKVDGVEGGLLRLTVIAGENACEECLMPKDIMVMMVEDSVQSRPEIRRIEVRYPHD
ncbi:MAG: hypothetical protein HYX94_04400 [Chloroflexi bacterium]|nr:hypothetical protein [Chloroflexota bacterium]